MSITQKVALVRTAAPECGLRPALAAVGLARATWYYYQRRRRDYAVKYRHLRRPLEAIARAHPEYGYRRAIIELRATWGHDINHKVVQRLHRMWDLPLLRRIRLPRPSGIQQAIAIAGRHANLIGDKADIEPFEVLYADFTELSYAGDQKGYLIALVDHATKIVVGWAVGNRKTTEVALQAWERAKQTLATCAGSWQGLIVHHDQDPVFVGYAWTSRLLLDEEVRVSYSLCGARGNPEMEAFFSRFKTENRSLLLDCRTLEELTTVIAQRIDYYNCDRRHSKIGYVAPLSYVGSRSLGTADE